MSSSVLHHSNIQENVRRAFSVIAKYKTIISEEAESQLSKVEFSPYELCNSVPSLTAIDGSYAPIFKTASMWLIAVRAAALKYRFSNSGTEGYEIEGCEINEGAELITLSFRIARELPKLNQELTAITAAKKSDAPKKMSAYVRILREFELARIMAEKLKDSLILMDGTLITPPVKLIEQSADETIEACERNGNTLIGVSKDSNTNYLGSVATDEEILRTVRKPGLSYIKIPKVIKGGIRPRGDLYFAKLHSQSPKWFRVDIAATSQEPEETFGCIAQFSRNQLSIGYPFPLVEAHLVAVELRKYPDLYDRLLFSVGQEMGLSFEDIVWGRTNVEGRRFDAFHAYLDLIAKKGRSK